MDDRLRLALLKESADYRAFWKQHGGEMVLKADQQISEYYIKNPEPIGHGRIGPNPACAAEKVQHDFFLGLFSFKLFFDGEAPRGKALEAFLDALNPYREELPDELPFYFRRDRVVTQLSEGKISPWENDFCVETAGAVLHLQPWERLLRIDLRHSKKDILDEVGRYLDRVAKLRKSPEACKILQVTSDRRVECIDWTDNYAQWQTDDSRARKEAWQHLKVWRLRRQRKSYLQIQEETGIRVDNAKKSFARAYELIEGRRYDTERYNRENAEMQSTELKKTCATCPTKLDCPGPCPDILPYYNQDYVGLKEKLVTPEEFELLQTPRINLRRK